MLPLLPRILVKFPHNEDNIDNAHFIGKWSIIGHPKFNPEIIFYGMPQFESIEEYLEIRKIYQGS